MTSVHTIERLLRQQAALAHFGSFAFGETDLQRILTEAVRVCAESLNVPFAKICRYRPEQNDLLIVAGYGWKPGVIGRVISQADESSTQGRAFVTGEPVILEDIRKTNSYELPDFYAEHGVISTADVLVKGANGPFGVLEVDCTIPHTFDQHDVNFLTGFANVVAEAVGTAERTATLQSTLVELRRLSEEKDVLAAELQHRVRNNLQLVYGMLIRQIEMPDQDGREGVRAIARRVMSLARIYDHLLGHGLVQTIDFGAYLQSLCISLQDFQERREFEVKLICEAEPMALELDTVTALGIIMTEITSNAYLHAFPGRPGTIQVTLTHRDRTGILEIADDGVGFAPQTASKRHGVGLVKRLIEQEQGTAEVRAGRGTAWTLTFPVAAVDPPPAHAALH
ncbi:sensor histidine kinase [uncultured Enterovirga sp.]|uniref:sensor histidine kinase n=1 Tax=uncultured Enterovirga sp. TaxID=2026352 RepID=UPI0035CBD8DF